MERVLRDGHSLIVLVRNPDRLHISCERLTVFQGDALNGEDLASGMGGTDVVVSALNTDGGTTLSKSMPLLIRAMEAEGIRRIITTGTAGILHSRIEPELLPYQSSESKRRTTRAA